MSFEEILEEFEKKYNYPLTVSDVLLLKEFFKYIKE